MFACTFCVFSTADFPPGNVSVTLYSDGVPLSKAQLHYYSTMEETANLLSRAADPVDFMCQVQPLKCFFIHADYSQFCLNFK